VRTRRGGLQMRTSAVFCAKNFGSFEIYGVSAQTGGVRGFEPCGHFADKGIYRNFVRASFMDGSLLLNTCSLQLAVKNDAPDLMLRLRFLKKRTVFQQPFIKPDETRRITPKCYNNLIS